MPIFNYELSRWQVSLSMFSSCCDVLDTFQILSVITLCMGLILQLTYYVTICYHQPLLTICLHPLSILAHCYSIHSAVFNLLSWPQVFDFFSSNKFWKVYKNSFAKGQVLKSTQNSSSIIMCITLNLGDEWIH